MPLPGNTHEYHTVRNVARKAVKHGATHTDLCHWQWTIAGNCEKPKTLVFSARPDNDHPRYRYRLTVDLIIRCRKCKPCLRARRRHWAARANMESAMSARTWFCTLTFGPGDRDRAEQQAMALAAKDGHAWSELDEGLKFVYQHKFTGPLVTKYLKRVREQSEVPIRLIVIAEPHKDGVPHYHALLHDVTGNLRYRVLHDQWIRHGFGEWKLVDTTKGAASYVAKYISKSYGDHVARVRASIGYGKVGIQIKREETSTVASQAPERASEVKDDCQAGVKNET